VRIRNVERRRLPWARLWLLGSFLVMAAGMAGCLTSRTINIAKEAGLAQITRLEIAELVREPSTHYVSRLTVAEPATLAQISAALDRAAPLGPLAECLSQYQLSFTPAAGEVQVLQYSCEGGESFLRGAQGFWRGQQARPPAEFDELMHRLLQGAAN
jgi:hypothetical protein